MQTERNPYRTKMIEVGLPLEAINAGAQQEKNPFLKGHPRALHLYWARRPISTCRAVLFSSLVDDPSADPAYMSKGEEAIQKRRQELHDQLAELVLWESTNDERIINRARAEIASSLASFADEKGEIDASDWPGVIARSAKPELVNKYLAEVAPPVLDPFAGGGSIPLEAQRLGLRAYASDLNPVAVLINKALIEIPPKFANQPPVNPEAQDDNLGTKTWKGAQGLAEDVHYYGQWMRDEAEKRIGHLYPKVKITPEMVKERPDLEKYQGQELTAIAWIWARTVPSPDPAAQGAHMPLMASFWLSKKKGKEVWLAPVVDGTDKPVRFKIQLGKPPAATDPNDGTVNRGGATCLYSDSPVPLQYIRDEGKAGRLNSQMVAIVLEGDRERIYLEPDSVQDHAAKVPVPDDIPITNLPEKALGFRVQAYGMDQHWKLFTNRQLAALCAFSDLVKKAREQVLLDHQDHDSDYADAMATLLACSLSHMCRYHSTLCLWNNINQNVAQVFGRQALPMVWDFAEANPIHGVLDFVHTSEWVARACDELGKGPCGLVTLQNAATLSKSNTLCLLSTDPPYYDNIGYADLSDFFYAWHKKSLGFLDCDFLNTVLTPKKDEMIASQFRHNGSVVKAEIFFQEMLETAIASFTTVHHSDLPLTIYYAFKQSEIKNEGTLSTGWSTFLEGVIKANLQITSCFPVRTERTFGLKGKVNALASSIVLACRPRAVDAGLTTRTDFVRELRTQLGKALADLQQSSIAPVDLQQAAIGPGMAVFSKFAKVLENDGSEMSVRAALGLINHALEEVLSEQEGEFDADTRFATIWFEQFGFDTGDYGTAETLAKAKAISVDGVVDSGILESTGGSVRLLKPEELDEDWTPEDDDRLTVWEVTHYLCRALETGGVDSAADLVHRVGRLADSARDLAYRLFSICDKKNWATEAQPYNALVASWPDIQNAAAQQPAANTTDEESGLFEG